MEFWFVYWFMFPVCIAIASAAMFSGISGAAMLMPVFLIGFPLLGVPPLTTVAAVGMSLFLETSGFGTGVYRYLRRGLVDTQTARRLALVTVPAAIVGSIAARWVSSGALRVGYGLAMIALAGLLFREPTAGHGAHLTGEENPGEVVDLGDDGAGRDIVTADGSRYRYRAAKLHGQLVLSGGGAVLAGLISTGVGEATLPGLVRRSGFPLAVAAATSTVVVAATVTGAAMTHLGELAREGGFAAIPWNLLAWAVPGAIVGALIGTHLQGRLPERASRLFFATLFGLSAARS
ncbi:MAG: sulfite exporter TauE/SafE family protein [Nitriliruptoraceae bacterium]